MNKKILLSTLVAGLLPASYATSAATHFNGWSAGGSVQMNASKSDIKFSDTDHQKEYDAAGGKKSAKFNHTALGLHADWSKTESNGLFYSFGFGVGYNFGNKKEKLLTSPNTLEIKDKRSFYGETTARVGMAFDKAVVYGLLSLRATKTKIEGYVDTTKAVTKSKCLFGFAPGVGVAYKVTNDMSVGLEYKYFMEGTASIGENQKLNKIRSHNLGLRVSYHF